MASFLSRFAHLDRALLWRWEHTAPVARPPTMNKQEETKNNRCCLPTTREWSGLLAKDKRRTAGPIVRPYVQAEEQETDAFKNRKRATTKSTKSDSKLHDSLPDFVRNLTTYELIPNKSSLGINPNSGKSKTGNRRPQNRRKTGSNQNKSRPNFSHAITRELVSIL